MPEKKITIEMSSFKKVLKDFSDGLTKELQKLELLSLILSNQHLCKIHNDENACNAVEVLLEDYKKIGGK